MLSPDLDRWFELASFRVLQRLGNTYAPIRSTRWWFTRQPSRLSNAVIRRYRPLHIVTNLDLLTPAFRYEIPGRKTVVPVDITSVIATYERGTAGNRALRSGRGAAAIVAHETLYLPDGPMTVEARFKADADSPRGGIVAKAESSEFGLHLGNRPHFAIHLDGSYKRAEMESNPFEAGRWYHIAGVYDGREVRLYIDGVLVASSPASGTRLTNDLPLVIGADVGRGGSPTNFFEGLIDRVRISSIARYHGDAFPLPPSFNADSKTTLLLRFDDAIGSYLFDDSGTSVEAHLTESSKLHRVDQ